ncbi:MAG TPA: NADH-quinone oxidoreductase subunit NuoE [Pseudomonadales bacterium]
MSELINPLSEEEIAAIEAEVAHVPDRRSAAIEALRIVQAKRGWVSDESLAAVARQLGMSVDELDAVATFYNLIFRRPVGRHVVMYCDSVSCYVMGCDRVREALERQLGVAPGGTTADERFTLLPIVCLGACDRAPVILVDEDLHGPVSPERLDEVLAGYE